MESARPSGSLSEYLFVVPTQVVIGSCGDGFEHFFVLTISNLLYLDVTISNPMLSVLYVDTVMTEFTFVHRTTLSWNSAWADK